MPSPCVKPWRLTRLAWAVLVVFVAVAAMAAHLIWSFSSGKVAQPGSHETAQLVAEDFQVDLALTGSLSESGGVMLADVQVPESQLANVYEGKQVLITIPDAGDLEVYGTVSRLSSEAQASEDADAQGPLLGSSELSYRATVALGYNPSSAKSGMEVVATVSVDELGEAFGVSPSSLGSDSGSIYMAVVQEDGSIKQVPVSVIGKADDGRLIVQGASLTAGLTVCTDLA